ncbi:hypothetical protein O5O45_19255 [Hahella aquimaris]|uniref:hypothetical protein n=1 Tax=Hahella sp. HNIBRBA332 TaxID=3015983 RepID=UPI00273B07DE|nr:hypothetical protein [Hahella sp. HNIBRBA332]WLQ11870.1 hypothetical protein O5O45_19255 [Hahella sp. HNIBRBA332]
MDIESVVWLSVPIIVFSVCSFFMPRLINKQRFGFVFIGVIIGFSGLLIGPRCLSMKLEEKIYGALIYSICLSLIIIFFYLASSFSGKNKDRKSVKFRVMKNL